LDINLLLFRKRNSQALPAFLWNYRDWVYKGLGLQRIKRKTQQQVFLSFVNSILNSRKRGTTAWIRKN